jgi:FMN phosphatase YigB (HAD superfamily)
MNVLLDFDGVLMQNTKIENIIKERSVRYVKSRTKLSMENAKVLNQNLYPKVGHTALIINNTKHYHNEVFEYNKEVFYTMNFQDDIRPCIHADDFNHIENILEILAENKKKPGLFTNTPLLWVEQNLQFLGLHVEDVFDTDMLFTSDEGFIKPKCDTYEKVDQSMGGRNTIFVDDSITNITTAAQFPNWFCFHAPNRKPELLYTYLKLINTIAK